MTVAYHEDDDSLTSQPREISYGDGGDAKLRFVYTARGDAETVTQGGAERARHLLLHTVRAVLDGRIVREYRLLSETASKGWRRLDKAQLCGYDEDGANPECLAALDVDWIDPVDPVDGYKTCVGGVTDPLGRATTFEYRTVAATGTAGLFAGPPTRKARARQRPKRAPRGCWRGSCPNDGPEARLGGRPPWPFRRRGPDRYRQRTTTRRFKARSASVALSVAGRCSP